MSEQTKVNKIEQGELVLTKLDNKDFGLYFFVLDTKGNPTGGIANIYEHVKVLNDLGYNAIILHEKDDYKLKGDADGIGLADWLGEEYAELPHQSIEAQDLNIGTQDFIIIPEIFSNVMDQVKAFPCKKIVFSQSYDYLLELLPIGRRWTDYGFNDVITTTQKQSDFIKSLFPSINSHLVPVAISDDFKDSDKPKIPMISIVGRNPGDAAKIAKMFYLQFPIYKWITFKELRGMPKKDFASELAKSCLAIWIDDVAGFGTFPLEAIKCNTPVIGKMPNMIPEWMEHINEEGKLQIKNNGIWTNTHLNIPQLISEYLKIWLEDGAPIDLLENMKTTNKYTPEKQKEAIESVYGNLVNLRKEEIKKIIAVVSEETLKTEKV
tara:strand:- start:46908 stop:48044 length:1137 start_codon:yes stop_codon:yes gene_type:complete